jgi:hypothetical protein
MLAGAAAEEARKNGVRMALCLAPATDRTTACGQPKRQLSCWQPVREA